MVLIETAEQLLPVHHLFTSVVRANVLAYLDPGSGSYLLQLLVAAALGGLLVLRLYWAKVKSFVRRLLTGKDDELDADE